MKTSSLAIAFLMFSAIAAETGKAADLQMTDFYYFTCNATGWALDDQTRLSCLDSFCIDLALEFEVTEPWMVTEHDTCSLVKTNAYNNWGTSSVRYGSYVEGPSSPARVDQMDVPAVARFYGSGSIAVKYPALGTYRIWVSRARGAFSISPVVADQPIEGRVVR